MKNKNKIKIIPHSKPFIDKEEIEAVSLALEKSFLSNGKIVSIFEKKISEVVGTRYACATSSGTAALYLILISIPRVLPEARGKKEVIIPALTCSAVSNAVKLAGYSPIIADVNPQTFALDIEDTKRKLNKNTACIVFIHQFGICSDIDDFLKLGVPIIEGIAQSFGGKTKTGKKAGSQGFASFSSFYATKVITTAEGGAVFSNSKKLIEEIKDFVYYDKKEDVWKTRFNFKMSDIHAAIGLAQLKKLKKILKIRKKIAEIYFRELNETEKKGYIKLPPKEGNIFFRFPIFLNNKKLDGQKVIEYLRKNGIIAERIVFRPLDTKAKMAKLIYTNSVSIPIHPGIKENDAIFVSKKINEIIEINENIREIKNNEKNK